MANVLVILLIALAAVYAGYRAWRAFGRRGAGCGCGTASCHAHNSAGRAPVYRELVQLNPPRSSEDCTRPPMDLAESRARP
jgi:hypothetical protein